MQGQTVSGNYNLRTGPGAYIMAYCDFSKSVMDPSIEHRVVNAGFAHQSSQIKEVLAEVAAVKKSQHLQKKELMETIRGSNRSSVEFVAVRYDIQLIAHCTRTCAYCRTSGHIKCDSGRISFSKIPLNQGGGMDLSGGFSVPETGDYLFIVSGMAYHKKIRFQLVTKPASVHPYLVYEDSDSSHYRTVTRELVWRLSSAETVYFNVNVTGGNAGDNVFYVDKTWPFIARAVKLN